MNGMQEVLSQQAAAVAAVAGNGESDGEDVLHLNEGGARRKKRAANGEGGVKTAVSMVNVIGTWVPPC